MAKPAPSTEKPKEEAAKPVAADAVPVAANLTADSAISNAALSAEADLERVERLRERQPFGAYAAKLQLPPIEGYKCHWFNDRPGRVEAALNAGWSYILDNGKPKSLTVGRDGLRAYAMKLPWRFWEEDVKRNEQIAADRIAAVKSKPNAGNTGGKLQATDKGTFYVPDRNGDDAVKVMRGPR